MYDLYTVVAIVGTFLLAGIVKGVIGLGLPTVSLGLLAVVFDLTTAMALLIVPSFVTNVWQAFTGGNGYAIVSRIWPFLVMATAGIWLGARALTRVDLSFLAGLLGGLLVVYAALNLAGVRFAIAPTREVWMGPLFGIVNGILTGMTGSFVVPGVMFLQAIGLSRDMLVQAMGMLFAASTAALAVVLQEHRILTGQLGLVSAAALIPAIAGMVVGRAIRRKLSERRFRELFFLAILALGFYIIASATLGAA